MLIPIHYVCNQDCIFCSAKKYSTKKAQSAPLSLFFDKMKTSGNRVCISGGEPLLSKTTLSRIIRAAKRQGMFVELQTNGTLVAGDKKYIKTILHSVDEFNINFSSHNSREDFAITRQQGAFAARCEGVNFLLSHGARVRLTYIINKKNYKNIGRFVRFIAKQFANTAHIQFSFVKAMGAASKNTSVVPRYSSVSLFLARGLSLCETYNINCAVDHIPLCFLGRHYMKSVDILKMASKCVGHHLAEKKKVDGCVMCLMKGICPGPRKDYVRMYGTAEFEKVRIRREH